MRPSSGGSAVKGVNQNRDDSGVFSNVGNSNRMHSYIDPSYSAQMNTLNWPSSSVHQPLVGHSSNTNSNTMAAYTEDDFEDEDSNSRLSLSHRDETNENFKVAVRVRPPLPRETEGPHGYINVIRITPDHKGVTICEPIDTDDGRGAIYSSQGFSFDYVYDECAQQKEVYDRSAKSAVLSVLQGYNATVIAYGQTGTGKTFTMEGFTNDGQRGIIPRSTEEIFRYIQNCRSPSTKFLVRASYVEIYNEVISDLLKPQNKNLTVRQSKERGVYVDGLSEWVVRSPAEIYGLMAQGSELRQTGATKMSERSSRSHAIFIVICETMEIETSHNETNEVYQNIKIGKLNIVDLAGSEKVRQSGVTGTRLTETKKINWSLHELGNVIAALTDQSKKDGHIPYRNSRLTKILKDSLGGNCKTTMIACISPALDSYAESLSTLKFANRAKNIKNDAVVNEDLDQRAMMRRYEKELKRLRQLLADKNRVDPEIVSQLEDKNRKAEEDRVAALKELQERSWEFEEAQQSQTKLFERIQHLEALLMNGGTSKDHDLALKSAMQKVSEEYMNKLDELDKERQVIEEDKAHVERYKQLLLKQRDIMVALTARLNERDEVILSLQEELDAYDDRNSVMEDYISQQKKANDETRQKLSDTERNFVDAQRELESMRRSPSFAHNFSAADVKLRETEARLEALRRQHAQFRTEMTERLDDRNRVISSLQEECDRSMQELKKLQGSNGTQSVSENVDNQTKNMQREMEKMRKIIMTHSKDRKALRTILEQRIKVKVDVIAVAMKDCLNRSASTPEPLEKYQQIETEIMSLQNLINASIGAMEGDA